MRELTSSNADQTDEAPEIIRAQEWFKILAHFDFDFFLSLMLPGRLSYARYPRSAKGCIAVFRMASAAAAFEGNGDPVMSTIAYFPDW